MTNREKFEKFLQGEVNLVKKLTDEELAINAGTYSDLCVHVRMSGIPCQYVPFGELIPDGQTERIVAWLREEAV